MYLTPHASQSQYFRTSRSKLAFCLGNNFWFKK